FIPPIELTGFSISQSATLFSAGSLTNPTYLAIPFQDVSDAFLIPGSNGVGTETAAVVSIPIGTVFGGLGGTISINSTLSFWGVEANTFIPLIDGDDFHLNAILGYRRMQLNESLTVTTVSGGQLGGTPFNGFTFPAGIFETVTADG